MLAAQTFRAANWQTPQELPDLRRVGVIALDTETNDEGLRADRGSAWPWRDGHICGISVAYRADSDIRAHYFPLRHPDSDNFDREQVYPLAEGFVSRPACASSPRMALRLGMAAIRSRHRDAAVRSPRRDRRARDHDRRKPVYYNSTRSAALRPARQGRGAAAASGRGRGLPGKARQGAHLATAGAICRPLRRNRCGEHARAV